MACKTCEGDCDSCSCHGPARSEAEKQGWKFVRASITNRAIPERAPLKPKELSPAYEYEEISKAQALAGLREIAGDMARILGNVKKPRIEFAPNRWCEGRFSHGVEAHSHIENGVRWVSGPRKGRKIPKGLICLNPRYVLSDLSSAWIANEKNWPLLMAHEIMHVRMPGGSHKRTKFKENVERLLGLYHAYKEGAMKIPDRRITTRSLDMTEEGDSLVELGAGDPSEGEDDT